MNKNKSGNFGFGIFIIFLAIVVSLVSFVTEENKITGFAAMDTEPVIIVISNYNLVELNDFKSLQTLSAGDYYVDNEGIVYWVGDESMPAIAKVSLIDESQKNRRIYVDDEGNIGYVLNSVLINENTE